MAERLLRAAIFFPFGVQRKVTLGVTCVKWQELTPYFHHGFSLFLLFLNSCHFVFLGAAPAQWINRQPTIFTSVLRAPVCSWCLPICPISSGSGEELSAFHFSVGDVANAVTVIWKSTQGELLLLLLKPLSSSSSLSSSGLFMVWIIMVILFRAHSWLCLFTPSNPTCTVCVFVLYAFDVLVNCQSCCAENKENGFPGNSDFTCEMRRTC